MLAAIALAVYIPMLIEAIVAARHERAQRARGGVEPLHDVFRVMRVAYPAAFGVMIAEGVIRGGPVPAVFAAGVAVFVLAKALKWWAIAALGAAWTFRVIVVPGDALVARGPYRALRHPNYLAVCGELIGAACMTGAALAGPIATGLFCALMLRRIRVEEHALDTSRTS